MSEPPTLSTLLTATEEPTLAFTALATSAIYDDSPAHTLRELCNLVHGSDAHAEDYLDAMTLVPLLLGSTNDAANDMLVIVGEKCSAKEVCLAAQEALESLAHRLASAENPDDDEEEGAEDVVVVKLRRLIRLFSLAIPRLTLKKKSAADTLRPVLDLASVTRNIQPTSSGATRDLAGDITVLVGRCRLWVAGLIVPEYDQKASFVLLRDTLCSTLLFAAEHLKTGIAQRTFCKYFPRLATPSMRNIEDGWEEDDRCVVDIIAILEDLGFHATRFALEHQSSASLIIQSHSPAATGPLNPLQTLVHVTPTIASVLRDPSSPLLDSTLALLISLSSPLPSEPPRDTTTAAPEDVDDALSVYLALLPYLASYHPAPQLRLIAFRVVGALLKLASPLLRFHCLRDWCAPPQEDAGGEDEYPEQWHVAAVSLLKDAFLDAFVEVSFLEDQGKLGPLAKMFLDKKMLREVWARALFVPRPRDALSLSSPSFSSSDASAEDTKKRFLESSEPERLVECLGVYYVLLKRDTENSTDILSRDLRASIDSSLLKPLHVALKVWRDDVDGGLRLNALEAAVARTDDAIEEQLGAR